MKKSLALFLTSLIVTLVVVVIVYVGYVKIHALTTVEGAFVGEWRGENKERADVITFRADGGYRRQTQFKAFDAGFYSEPARSETASGVWRCKRDPNGPNGIDAGTLYLSNSKNALTFDEVEFLFSPERNHLRVGFRGANFDQKLDRQ